MRRYKVTFEGKQLFLTIYKSILITVRGTLFTQRPRGVARTEAEAKKFAEEDAAIAKAKEEARAAAAALAKSRQTNGTYDSPKPKISMPDCMPTLPDSAVITPSSKGPRMEGQRNLQDSTFSISGKLKGGRIFLKFLNLSKDTGDRQLKELYVHRGRRRRKKSLHPREQSTRWSQRRRFLVIHERQSLKVCFAYKDLSLQRN